MTKEGYIVKQLGWVSCRKLANYLLEDLAHIHSNTYMQFNNYFHCQINKTFAHWCFRQPSDVHIWLFTTVEVDNSSRCISSSDTHFPSLPATRDSGVAGLKVSIGYHCL